MKRTTALSVFALILLPFLGFAQEASSEEDFFGEDAETVSTVAVTSVDPTEQFSEDAEGLRWGGTVSSSATWNSGWVGQWPSASDPAKGWQDGLDYGLSTKLFLDGRPDADFRFRLSLKTGYPFTNSTTALKTTTTSTTIEVPNIEVWEMFTDVTVADAVFLRFGKQSASWGVAYFYSPGDVISLTAKDASDPLAEREGPVALKATVPFPNLKANLTGYVLARDSYFGTNLPTLQSMGYALQGDVLVGDAQLSLGGFYQQDNAPKAVATVNTGLSFLKLPVFNDINVFSESVFSYGSDVLKTSGKSMSGTFTTISAWEKTVYYTGTLGASYSNSDANLNLRSEYLFNPFGSDDATIAQRAFNTFGAYAAGYTAGITNTSGRAYGYGDAVTPGIHYLTSLASLSKLGGSDKLSFSTLWQQNLSDVSGWVKPSLSFKPWDQLGFTWGVTVVYGDEGTQYPLTFQARDSKGTPLGTKRVTMNVGVTFGTGRY